MNFSRRQATAPSPPSPALTLIRTSSTNFTWPPYDERRGPLGSAALATSGTDRRSGLRHHRDDAAIAAGLRVLHGALGLREEREVLAHPDVLAGVEERADLADQDVAGNDVLRAVDLHATALTLRVAAVAAGALSLFVSHGCFSLKRGRTSRGP